MTQPTPTVSRTDVERIVRRDYSPDRFEEIMSMLNEYGSEDWQREPDRVRLAILKLADRNIDELRRFLEWAKCDYRDVISPAEYPLASRKWSKMKQMTRDAVETIYGKDWEQYQQWLNKG